MNKLAQSVSPEVIGHCRVYKNPEAKIVVAVSTFAGKTVRGVAKCHPNDEFDAEKGTKLAIARCNYKVALKRQARADRKVREAIMTQYEAQSFLMKMKDYQRRSALDVSRMANELEDLEKSYV